VNSPAFALRVPRPLVWLLARGVVRDLTLEVDASAFVGQVVGLVVAERGDAQGYRRLTHLLAGTAFEGVKVAQVRAESPKGALVGMATVAKVVATGNGWRTHLEQARPVGPVLLPRAAVEVVALPQVVL
jgi:hypothetical protein